MKQLNRYFLVARHNFADKPLVLGTCNPNQAILAASYQEALDSKNFAQPNPASMIYDEVEIFKIRFFVAYIQGVECVRLKGVGFNVKVRKNIGALNDAIYRHSPNTWVPIEDAIRELPQIVSCGCVTQPT